MTWRLTALAPLLTALLLLGPGGDFSFAQDAAIFEAPDAAAEAPAAETLAPTTEQQIGYSLDNIVLFICAVLVFFMQPGFAMVEAGFNSSKHTVNILFKNALDICVGVIFGASQGIGDSLTVTYIGLAGDMGLNGEGYNHSIVADFALSEKWNYVVQSDYVRLNFDSIGINNFLFYTINEKLAVGGRAEWYKSNLAGNGWESVYVTTAGVNIKPMANLIIRPEMRYQWGAEDIINGLSGTNGQPGVANQGIFGIDAILTF